MPARAEKRWLKSVVDPDLVGFFEDSQFDAAEYAKGFYEQREAGQAPRRVEKLEGLKRQTESALREEVVRNYKAFMHATEEIRTMEAGIQTLKDLLGSTAVTLQGVLDRQKEKINGRDNVAYVLARTVRSNLQY